MDGSKYFFGSFSQNLQNLSLFLKNPTKYVNSGFFIASTGFNARLSGTGLTHTPKSSFLGATQSGNVSMSGSPSQIGANNSYLPGYLLGGNTPTSQMVFHLIKLFIAFLI